MASRIRANVTIFFGSFSFWFRNQSVWPSPVWKTSASILTDQKHNWNCRKTKSLSFKTAKFKKEYTMDPYFSSIEVEVYTRKIIIKLKSICFFIDLLISLRTTWRLIRWKIIDHGDYWYKRLCQIWIPWFQI